MHITNTNKKKDYIKLKTRFSIIPFRLKFSLYQFQDLASKIRKTVKLTIIMDVAQIFEKGYHHHLIYVIGFYHVSCNA